MNDLVICEDRQRILDATGHVLVTGGPGSGKTTIALRKAVEAIQSGLEPGQKVLFLSFSRAAVARIVESARRDLNSAERRLLEIQTFHSFCWQLLRGHGYLLGAPRKLSIMLPHDEKAFRAGADDDDPQWLKDREEFFLKEGRIVFDLFAPKCLELLQRSEAFRRLVASRYPLIIVDEAQDTGDEQWACINALRDHVQLVCLADLEQQIYDFRPDVSPERLAQIMKALDPIEVELGAQNNRSPGVEIVKFGNDILADTPRGYRYEGVHAFQFNPAKADRDRAIRQALGRSYKLIKERTGRHPKSIAVLTNWGKGVAVIARALQGDENAKYIRHRVVMDEAEVLLASRVVALLMEPVRDVWSRLAQALDLLSELHRAKGSVTSLKKAVQLQAAAVNARNEEIKGRAKAAPALKLLIEALRDEQLTGNPGADWLAVRDRLAATNVAELKLVANLVVYLMAFNRGRRISDSLAEVWLRTGTYEGARLVLETAIEQDQIIGGDTDLDGINVMTIHKSKAKEFDGVVILHLGRISPITPDWEKAPYAKSRKLLRVGVTRARHEALLLMDAATPCPLLRGHHLAKDAPASKE
jgi:DNA helicase-2/ATP-dependent DNA helicase PcrA